MYKVTVRSGVSHAHIAVTAANEGEAEDKVRSAGYVLTGATTTAIDAYGIRFCDVLL